MVQPSDTRTFHGWWLALLVFGVGVGATPAHGQIGGTTDILTGVVLGPDSQPMANVTIEALSLETQITRTTISDARGRYTLLFPDGGGQYRMTARFIGMSPRQFTLVRYANEDRLVWDVQMSSQPMRLSDIEVRAFLTPVRIPDRPTPRIGGAKPDRHTNRQPAHRRGRFEPPGDFGARRGGNRRDG